MDKNPIDTSPVKASTPKAIWLGDIAQHDPKLAYTLLRSGQLTAGGYVDTGGWEIINLKGTFTSPAADQTVKGQLFGTVEADLWVRRVTYTVRRPFAFAGNIFKAQSDYFNKLNPNIDFTLLINSYNRYVISPEQTPLENIETVFEAVAPAGLVLRCSANIVATFTNTRPLIPTSGTPSVGEIPTEAIISLHATRLPTNVYGSCNQDMAIAMLQEMGYLPGKTPDGEGCGG